MKYILLAVILFFSSSFLFAQTATEEKAIAEAVQRLNEIWNRHDMDAYCDLFTEDGTWINIVGMFWQNRADLCKAHRVIKEAALKYWTAKMDLVKVRIIAPNVAIAYIYETIHVEEDYSLPDGKKFSKGDISYDQISVVYLKTNNEWKITAGHNTVVDQKMKDFNPIK
jgi:uncharacterized protein (TIGR02246 family)